MKTFSSAAICFLSLVFAANGAAQTSPPSIAGGQFQSVPPSLGSQQDEINMLREELRREAELRKQQAATIEALVDKIDKIAALLPGDGL